MKLEAKIQNYQPSEAAKQLIRQTKIVLLVGVSGAGKDTIKHRLLDSGRYHHIVSHTTRHPRLNQDIMETDGVEYHFIDLPTAETLVDNKGYVEVNYYSGNVYGTSVAEIQLAHDEGKAAITDMEVQGVDEYMKIASDTVKPIFILPPTYEIWQERLSRRYTSGSAIANDNIDKRLATSKLELEQALAQDYFYFVINDDIDQAVRDIETIVQESGDASKYRSNEAKDLARSLLAAVTAKH